MQVRKELGAGLKNLRKVRGSGAYSLTELADKLLPEVLSPLLPHFGCCDQFRGTAAMATFKPSLLPAQDHSVKLHCMHTPAAALSVLFRGILLGPCLCSISVMS